MTAKQRIKQLEKSKAQKSAAVLNVVWLVNFGGDGVDQFQGVTMPHEEAEAKYLQLPDHARTVQICLPTNIEDALHTHALA